MDRYYAVNTKVGHVGKGKYIEVTFAIKAENGREAARIAREMPRVKRDNPMAIIDVNELSYDEYLDLLEDNKNNPYLKCKSRQDQNMYCPDIYKKVKELYEEVDSFEYKEKRRKRIEYLFKKRKILGDTLRCSHRLVSRI